jgi:hypothetical protein
MLNWSENCAAELVTAGTLVSFLYFYSSVKPIHPDAVEVKANKSSSSSSPSPSREEQNNKSSRFKDIILFRKGLSFSLHEINRCFALTSLSLLSVGLSLKAVLGNKNHSSGTSQQKSIEFLSHLVWLAATLGRLHAGYSAIEFFKRFKSSSPFLGGMIMGVLTVNLINLISPYDIFESPMFSNIDFVKNTIAWGKQNYESSSLIVLGATVGHFVSIDTSIDIRSKKNDDEEKNNNTNVPDFVMNLRPFGYVALGASCIGALLIAFKDLI